MRMSARRARDAAVALPLGGALLFLPPYIKVFDHHVFVFGLPLLPLFIFSAWLIGLVLTALLARRLIRVIDGDEGDGGERSGRAAPGPMSERGVDGAGARDRPEG